MNNKIANNEQTVPKTIELNDRDYLNIVLETEKNMSNNLSIAIDEASNEVLYNKYYSIFNQIKTSARNAYNIMFKNGWYELTKAKEEDLTEEHTKLNEKINELTK